MSGVVKQGPVHGEAKDGNDVYEEKKGKMVEKEEKDVNDVKERRRRW